MPQIQQIPTDTEKMFQHLVKAFELTPSSFVVRRSSILRVFVPWWLR